MVRSPFNKQTSVKLTEKQYKLLQKIATQQGLMPGVLVRVLVVKEFGRLGYLDSESEKILGIEGE